MDFLDFPASEKGLHLQSSGLQTLSRAGKNSAHYIFRQDLVFALLQGLGEVHIFCNHADSGLVVLRNDLILFSAHE